MKTPTVTAMAGAQTTINNQLKAATETATVTATTMTMETKATAVAEARWQHLKGGGQLGSSGGSLGESTAVAAAAARWRCRQRQRSGGVGSGSAMYLPTYICFLFLVRQCQEIATQKWADTL